MLDLPSLTDGMREHAQHEHFDGQHDHYDVAGEGKLHEGPMDLAAVRAKRLPNGTTPSTGAIS